MLTRREEIEYLQDAQGWTDATLLRLLLNIINEYQHAGTTIVVALQEIAFNEGAREC